MWKNIGEEIIDKIRQYEFADIQISINGEGCTDYFGAFFDEPEKTNILLRTAIKQFLDRTDEKVLRQRINESKKNFMSSIKSEIGRKYLDGCC